MSGMRISNQDHDNSHCVPQVRTPNKKNKRSNKHGHKRSSKQSGLRATDLKLYQTPIRTSLSSNTLSNYLNSVNNYATRGM